jgi:SAM-dependent methyltransferase
MRVLVRSFVAAVAAHFSCPDPVVEIGAFQVPGQEAIADLRPLFPDRLFVGMDLRPGKGVDCVADGGRLPLGDETVGTLLLLDTLEHVWDVHGLFREAHRVLRPGGILLASTVMNFPIHEHPWDFWRFTPEALERLAKAFAFRWVGSVGRRDFPHTLLLAASKSDGEGAGADLFHDLARVLDAEFSRQALRPAAPTGEARPVTSPDEALELFSLRDWRGVRTEMIRDFTNRFLADASGEGTPFPALLLPESAGDEPPPSTASSMLSLERRETPYGNLWVPRRPEFSGRKPSVLYAPLALITGGRLERVWTWIGENLDPGGILAAGVPNLGYLPFVVTLSRGRFPIREPDLESLHDAHSLAESLRQLGAVTIEVQWAPAAAPEGAVSLPGRWPWASPYAVVWIRRE